MTSPRRIPATQSVSLFPFLAVLLCTMGALLVLLVVMARQARVRAVQETGDRGQEAAGDRGQEAKFSRNAEGVRAEIEARTTELATLRDRAKQLDQVNREATSRLGTAQLHLGHSEEQLRSLQDRIRAAYASSQAMDDLEKSRLTDREQAIKEIDRLKDIVRETEAEVEQARKNLEQRPKSYAIIPYEGINGTHRRPLYIECRGDAVVLLPEGIELKPNDFQGPMGPGNPLAAALRAAREYHTANHADSTAKNIQPYPLLLVRPNGIAAYYLAREAIESWGPDFGYELIDGDWSLELPPADPRLAHLEYRAIEAARARQRQLALAAPRRFRGSYGNGNRGGENAGEFSDTFDVGGRGQKAGGRLAATPESHVRPGQTTLLEQPTSQEQPDRHAVRTGGVGGSNDANGANGPDAPLAGRRGHPAIDGGESNQPMGDNPQDRESTYPSTEPSGQHAASTQEKPSSPQDKQTAGLPNGRSGNTRGGSPGGALGGSQAFGAETPSGASQSGSRQGLGGGSQERSRDAVPIRRAIHVVVRRDQLAILPEQGAGGGYVVQVAESVDAAMDEFVSVLKTRMQGWGIAGHGLYWKPILVLRPAPDGTANADRLARRLRGSGIEIQIPGTTRR